MTLLVLNNQGQVFVLLQNNKSLDLSFKIVLQRKQKHVESYMKIYMFGIRDLDKREYLMIIFLISH